MPKKIRENLKKEHIAGSKGYMKWYRVFDNELRLFVNEKALNENNEKLNIIYWRENRAILCVDGLEYSKKFYEKHKELDVKFFVKSDVGALYSEYAVKSFGLCDRGIEVILMENE